MPDTLRCVACDNETDGNELCYACFLVTRDYNKDLFGEYYDTEYTFISLEEWLEEQEEEEDEV